MRHVAGCMCVKTLATQKINWILKYIALTRIMVDVRSIN